KASTRILATACLLGASAYAQTSTQQCTFQSSYPNPVDADGNAVGALLKVSFKPRSAWSSTRSRSRCAAASPTGCARSPAARLQPRRPGGAQVHGARGLRPAGAPRL